MQLIIEEYKAVATWKWALPEGADDTCGICRVDFEGTCARCKYPGEDCPVSIGECSHCFHLHCIQNWVNAEASQGRCPMCRQAFRERVAATAPAAPTMAPRTPHTPQTRRSATNTTAGSASGSRR